MNNINQFFFGGGLRIYLRLPKVVFAIRGKVGINHKDLRTENGREKMHVFCMVFSKQKFMGRT